ncbi:hypothetical protein [Sphingopyxis witflariensis]|uniref:Phytoene synthase n=1 Tax=Sphingopyxis witflariensis TaxID=173675 RepID=A0A246K522_9SPHN|nr:hypothetical protein [Sphingopyxis witflariensis]OWR01077.1 hypothetical protein CDQ91_01205 [Sphingopyxis witflariensis]
MTTETDPDAPHEGAWPDIRDPRLMVAVPHARRPAMTALWALAARLTRLLIEAREPLIAQIKLAWWRDMAALIASDPDALPKGEPLLAELHATWGGQVGLETLVDAAEAVLLAEDDGQRRDAAAAFGAQLFRLSGGGGGDCWGLLWGASVQEGEHEALQLIADAHAIPTAPRTVYAGNRALLMLDRWARAIATHDGERHWRSEGLLLFRIGLLGR